MAYKRTPAKQQEMRENYNRLRAAGFSPLEASRLRSASTAKVNAAIVTGQRPPVSEIHQRAGRGESYTYAAPPVGPYGTHTGRIRESDYKDVTLGYTKVYHSKYAYLMTYETDQNGVRDRKYYTILSDEKLTKQQLKEEVKANTTDPAAAGKYQAKVIVKSIELVEAYYNPDFD